MKSMRDLAEELEREVGVASPVAEVMGGEESLDGAIVSDIPVTEKGDAVLGCLPISGGRGGDLILVSVIHEKGMRTYILEETELDRAAREISSLLENRMIYATGRELHEFQERFFPLGSTGMKTVDELPRHLIRGIERRAIFLGSTGGGMASIVARFTDHMFALYHIYLRAKQDAKTINYGKYKVKVRV